MEKEESMASSPKGICEKLFSAFFAKPALRSFHRTTHPSNPSQPIPSQASKNHLGPQNTSPSSSEKPEKRIEAEVVPIEIVAFLPSPLSSKERQNTSKQPITPTKEKGKAAKVAQEVDVMSPQVLPHEKVKERRESKKNVDSAPTSDEKASSEVEEKKKAGSANIDEKASDYIKRAKLKIRSTSSAGVAAIGRAISFK